MSDIYRLVYTSQNLLEGGEEEQKAAIAGLLAVSKRNNARVGVTGALLFNGGSFAQVLEGSRAAVEATFERIQRDPRHSDVAVLQCEPVATRGFPNWSMGFVGDSPRGRALWGEVARLTNFDLSRLEGNVLFNTLLSIVKVEEFEAAPMAPVSAAPRLDVAQLRSELKAQHPGEHPPAQFTRARPTHPSPVSPEAPALVAQQIEAGVLRTALDDERLRTSDLRRDLDETLIDLQTQAAEAEILRTQLAVLSQEVELLRRHRDIWAERTKAMAAMMMREPDGEDERHAREAA